MKEKVKVAPGLSDRSPDQGEGVCVPRGGRDFSCEFHKLHNCD